MRHAKNGRGKASLFYSGWDCTGEGVLFKIKGKAYIRA